MRRADWSAPWRGGWAGGGHSAWVALAAFAWFAATAWMRPLTMPDEGRYAGVAWSMLASGDWLVPRLDGLPFFHKPPLFYWIGAAAMKLMGVSEFAARMPSLLGATLAVAGLHFLGTRWGEPRRGLLAAVVLAAMPLFYIGAQFANLDMLVAGLIAATIVAAVHATLALERGGPWRAALALAYALAGLGLLAKGLIGVVLPGAVWLLWAARGGRWRRAWRLLAFVPGWLLLAAIALPWLVAMQLRYPAFFDYFIVTQHFRRFSQAGFNNAQPFWFFVPVLLLLALPWPLWLLVSRRGAQGAREEAAQGAPSGEKSAARMAPRLDWLMLCWLVTVVVFFSIPRSKLVGYVLPAVPALAWFVARALELASGVASRLGSAPGLAADRPRGGAPAVRWTAALAAVLCVGGAVALAVRETRLDEAALRGLAGQVRPGDRVVMLDDFFYQVPFYWRLSGPVFVVSDWRAPPSRDNWAKELYDAGTFEPAAAARVLVDVGGPVGPPSGGASGAPSARALPLAEDGVTWVIGGGHTRGLPALAGHVARVALPGLMVWRIEQHRGAPAAAGAQVAP